MDGFFGVFSKKNYFSEMSGNEVNPAELISTFINQGASFKEGLQLAQEAVQGSCLILLLTEKWIPASRDKLCTYYWTGKR